ncbi:GFA family protein, partial [Oceanibaculum sp.]|uniref:GFA family protein n=1 Tax=Oceanibaculum sp. TaxID=1903597 RepID=UPI00258EE189
MTEARYEGGCLCGAGRYEATGPVRQAGWCHCRLCQRSVGAPAVPWGSFFLENFRWTKGKPALHHSTPQAERSFCAECGTSLTFRYLTTE